jgi:hypothetical protein
MEENGMGEICNTQWKIRSTYKSLVEKPERKRLIRRPMRSWEHNIKIKEIGLEDVL